jgi:AcrR family transcriptional regulator
MRNSNPITETAKLRHTGERARIVETAIEYIKSDGLPKFSVKKLADKCGVSKPAIYYYFADEREVLREVYRALLVKETVYLKGSPDSLSDSELPPIRDVQAFIGGVFECEELDAFAVELAEKWTITYIKNLLPCSL